jgi:hypothetical protein
MRAGFAKARGQGEKFLEDHPALPWDEAVTQIVDKDAPAAPGSRTCTRTPWPTWKDALLSLFEKRMAREERKGDDGDDSSG